MPVWLNDRFGCAAVKAALVAPITLGVCGTAVAHVAAPDQAPGASLTWNADWWLWLLIGISGWLYARGVRRLWRSSVRKAGVTMLEVSLFAAGWLALIAALLSPLDKMGGELFSAHMVQHELLMLVAAPLLLLGRPLGPYLWALPRRWRQPVVQLARELAVPNGVRFMTRPLPAWLVGAVALWVWHIPALFEAALLSKGIHTLQHLSFFVSAVLFWWSLMSRTRTVHGVAVLSVVTTALHSSLLGALLTFSGSVWYGAYNASAVSWGLTPLEDQQFGGLIMWVPGGLVYLTATLVLTSAWLHMGVHASTPSISPVETMESQREPVAHSTRTGAQ
jgi:putative membrane protein